MWTWYKRISRCSMNDDSVFNWEECCCVWAKRVFLQLWGAISSKFHPASPSSGECLLGCLPVLGWLIRLPELWLLTLQCSLNRISQSDSLRKLLPHFVHFYCVGWRLTLAGRQKWGSEIRWLIEDLNYKATHKNIRGLWEEGKVKGVPSAGLCHMALVSHRLSWGQARWVPGGRGKDVKMFE